MFKKLEIDITKDSCLQKVFNYGSLEDSDEAFDTQLWYLLNEPRFEGQVEIVKKLNGYFLLLMISILLLVLLVMNFGRWMKMANYARQILI